MPCRIKEKEGEGVRLQTMVRVLPPVKERGKKNLRFGQADRAPGAKLPSTGPYIQRISRD